MDREEQDERELMSETSERESAPDTSIRGSIRAAIEEAQESDVSDKGSERSENNKATKEVEEKSEKPQRAQDKSSENARSASKSENNRERDGSGKFAQEKDKQVVSSDNKDATKQVSSSSSELKPPVGWTKEGKAAWETLSPDVQKSVLKREEEFSNGIKQYADKAKAYEELDQVIAPYKQMISQYGVTPVQTVAKLFEWMHALGQPNQEYKAAAFKMLAEQFQFDISNLAPRMRMTEEENTNQFDPRLIDQTVNQRLQPIAQELATFKQAQEQEQRRAAAAQLADWAKDKPYYEQVKHTMHRLFTSGEVPIEGGTLDLDTAYAKACRLNENVWASIQAEEQQRIQAEAQEKAAREAKEKAERFARKQNLSVGVRPNAPTMPISGIQQKKPANNGKPMSVRDSLRASMQEIREGTS